MTSFTCHDFSEVLIWKVHDRYIQSKENKLLKNKKVSLGDRLQMWTEINEIGYEIDKAGQVLVFVKPLINKHSLINPIINVYN